MNNPEASFHLRAIRTVPRTGVIFVMEEAAKHGYKAGDGDWINLGQGAPETGPLPDAPPRLENISVNIASAEYAPVGGLPRLREAVADLYNRRFRQGKASQYGPENVAISSGGRAGLTRIAAAIDRVHLGHFLPDYTAYEELLELFRDFLPMPILNEEHRLPSVERLRQEIVGRGLGALLTSNPCNPTGDVVHGEALRDWVALGREQCCTLIFDEFYSHYVYGAARGDRLANSAAEFVEDVNNDPVLVLDGLTKSWRYPGLRLSWTLGPAPVIEAIASAASFLDGGAPHPVQEMAVSLLQPEHAQAEARSIQATFESKRRFMIDRVREIGFELVTEPLGAFYCFVSLANLPEPLRDGMAFFQAALKKRVITVPGQFFDVNPGQRRSHMASRMAPYLRLSYGPSMAELQQGLDRLEAIVKSA